MEPVIGGPEEGLVSWIDLPQKKGSKQIVDFLEKAAAVARYGGVVSVHVEEADLREAARLLVPYEQPEVEGLLLRAKEFDRAGRTTTGDHYRAHAAALVALAETRKACADQLEAALRPPGEIGRATGRERGRGA
jgi:hypothetical protein